MPRIACLLVPDLPLSAVLRSEPDLGGEPLAVVTGSGPQAAIVAVSATAARHGVTPGLSMAQARAVFADLVTRPASSDCRRAAQNALVDVAYSFSPRVEAAGDGEVYLDVEGTGSLFESEAHLAHMLATRAARVGLPAHAGIAGSKIAAYLAARNGGGATVIPPGEEWSHLAPLPVDLLAPSPALHTTLIRWGIRRIGDLAALPASAVATRLGPEGLLLVRRARGEDEQLLVPRPAPLQFEESIELDYGIETLEPLAFVLRGLLDRLTARLAVRGLVCGDLRLALGLMTRGHDERTVVVAAPSNDVKALLTLMRLHLEAHPPAAPVEVIRLGAVPESLRALQLDLFRPNGPAPERLAVTLARLTALCGADHVGAPVVVDSHRPEAYGLATFQTAVDSRQSRKSVDSRQSTVASPCPPPSHAGSPSLPRRGSAGGPPTQDPRPETRDPALRLALRALRPPRPLEVYYDRGRLEFVRGEGISGRVVSYAGPWRVSGEWWHEGAYARDYFDVQLSDGGVYRLFWDHDQWFVAGIYD